MVLCDCVLMCLTFSFLVFSVCVRVFRVYDATATGVYNVPNESLIATHVPVHTATATLQK